MIECIFGRSLKKRIEKLEREIWELKNPCKHKRGGRIKDYGLILEIWSEKRWLIEEDEPDYYWLSKVWDGKVIKTINLTKYAYLKGIN